MGFFWKEGVCPECRSRGAQLAVWSAKVKCRKPSCANYDSATQQLPAPPAPAPLQLRRRGTFDPGPSPVTLRYVNYQGEERTFTAERATLRPAGDEHISARVTPTGEGITLAKKWLNNYAEIQSLLKGAEAVESVWTSLTPVERQIVGYHRKYKSTSPRFEEILRKHPELGNR